MLLRSKRRIVIQLYETPALSGGGRLVVGSWLKRLEPNQRIVECRIRPKDIALGGKKRFGQLFSSIRTKLIVELDSDLLCERLVCNDVIVRKEQAARHHKSGRPSGAWRIGKTSDRVRVL